MTERASVCWYRIQKCGYYSNPQTVTPEFGGLTQVLQDLSVWSDGKQLTQTLTFNADQSAHGDDQLPVYLLDIRGSDDNWLLKLWNQTPATDGQIASISNSAIVGSPGVVMNKLEPNTIPGITTYFYFVPSLGAVAAIRFQHRVFGHAPMKSYISGFLRQNSRHVCWSNAQGDDGHLKLLGYAAKPNDEPANFRPYFKSELMRLPGQHEQLILRARDVRKVVRRVGLQSGRRPDESLWQNLLLRAGLTAKHAAPEMVRLQYELSATLDPTEMVHLISQWEQDILKADDWEDVGFVFRGDPLTHWLSSSVARSEHDLDVKRDNVEVVNTQSLLDQLVRHRDAITSSCRIGS